MTPASPSVLVLLATYNGGRYLDEQLASLASQSVDTADILASDDGSSDDTRSRLSTWQTRWSKGRFEIVDGPRQGFAENFRRLILGAGPADYVAFCDQDDVWDSDKLAAAIAVLGALPSDRPALYGSRSRLIDEDGRPVGMSPLFPRPPGFRNALVQSLVGGNTMLLNRAAFALLRESVRRTPFLMHDWWSYLVVSGAGGTVHYDPSPHISYRQHRGNAVGGGISLFDRPRRLMELLTGKFSRWSDTNIAALQHCRDLLTPHAQQGLDAFIALRAASPLAALPRLAEAGLYRQTMKGDVAMVLGVMLGRL